MKLSFEVSPSHAELWTNSNWRYAILMGGRGQGRSGTASRYTVSQLVSKEYTRGLVMRATREDIRASSWQALIDRIVEQDALGAFKVTDNDMTIEYGQNSVRAFGFKASSGSLTARLKSIEGVNFVHIEEAEEIGEDEFMKLDDTLRTVKGRIRILLTLNTPSISHWIIKRWFNTLPSEEPGFYNLKLKDTATDTLYIGGTFRENAVNLDPATVTRYEGYRHTNPAYYWQVIQGLAPEVVMGRIYNNWQELPSLPHEARLLGYGLDFGFDPDPAALVAVYWHNGGYILDEKIYANSLTNQDLANIIKLLPTAPIIADSAEPKSIEELSRLGVNVIGVAKGTDSVRYGIKHVQGLKVSYTAKSSNIKREYENYAWKLNKDGEDTGIEDPKCDQHAMSAFRYFAMETIKANADPEAQLREYYIHQEQEKVRIEQVASRYGL